MTHTRKKLFAPGGLRQRLVRSHTAVASIGVVMLLIALLVVAGFRASARRLAQLRAPTAQSSALALAGVERSLAELRGWVTLGSPEFKTQRATAWAGDVEPAIRRLEELSALWTDPENVRRLWEVKAHLKELKQAQWWIEDVAMTPGNQPARVRMTQEVGPVADQIINAIDALITIERDRPAATRSACRLADLAELRTEFVLLRAPLDRFADSGIESDLETFEARMPAVPERLSQLRELNPEQSALAELAGELLLAFESLAREVVEARRSPQWNVALFRLRTEALPHARAATHLLREMSDHQSILMAADARQVSIVSDAAPIITICLIALTLLVTRLVSRRNAERLVAPIAALSEATKQFTEGKLDHDLPVTGDAELMQLTASFNTMRAAREKDEQTIRERTAELERSNSELRDFASVASHDLKEPLRVVSSYCELLSQRYSKSLDEKAERYLSHITTATGRMRRLINDLLDYSRVGTRGGEMVPTPLGEALDDAETNLEIAIRNAKATILRPDRLPTVLADRGQLVQLLQNLIGNGLKFGGTPPTIRISARPSPDQEQRWEIGVSDNGPGIAPEDKEQIFGIFERLQSHREVEGTGIGLAICRRIMERHGGEIRVESELGDGASFLFELAAVPDPVDGEDGGQVNSEHESSGA